MSKAASFVMKCIMLILGAILKPAGRAWSWADYHQQKQQPRDDDVAFLRDLESGDPEIEHERERDSPRREGGGERDRGMSYTDEDDINDNPWWKNSLDSLVGARSVHGPGLDGDVPRGLDALGDDELLHPDAFDIDPEDEADPFVEPSPEPTPEPTPLLNPYEVLAPLRAISTLELDDYEADDEDEDEDEDIGATPIAAGDFAGAAAWTRTRTRRLLRPRPPRPPWRRKMSHRIPLSPMCRCRVGLSPKRPQPAPGHRASSRTMSTA